MCSRRRRCHSLHQMVRREDLRHKAEEASAPRYLDGCESGTEKLAEKPTTGEELAQRYETRGWLPFVRHRARRPQEALREAATSAGAALSKEE